VTSTLDNKEIAAAVRPITDEEVADYHEHGWVMLRQLVSLEVVAALREEADGRIARHTRESDEEFYKNFAGMAGAGLDPYHSLMFDQTMAQNAQRLAARRRFTDRDVALRYRTDLIANKEPHGAGTPYHQDSAEHGSDRIGEMQFWLALVDITPEMGSMRFLPGVQCEGPLGAVFKDDLGDLLEQYPKLTELYPLSPQLHYAPGDATVHQGYMVHGAPPNDTDRHRLAYLFSYVPDDTRWWNGTTENWGSERVHLPDERYPVVAARQEIA
jgi:ectoine hydroxylase-related dioxygenase (phytanoyl-CoA dioxygenase family)